jgi:hypothetical protein
VKVLDFGLAKAWTGEAAASGSSSDLSQSPTLVDTGTAAGVILGTAAYMSPEQARGRAVDKKTDIFAFGIVLWEMLTGRRLFAGETVSDVLAAILTREVDFGALPASTPPELVRLLKTCLERNPKNRLHDIADARLALAELEKAPPPVAAPTPSGIVPVRSRAFLWVVAVGAAAVLGFVAARLGRPLPSTLPTYRRLTNDNAFVYDARFAPDGASIIYGEAGAGSPVAIYTTPSDSSAPRRFDWPSADVAGVSANGQLALLLGRHHAGTWLTVGTLAQASLAGGAPRPILENVYDADISKDGSAFAVVRDDGQGQKLEYPPGKVLARTTGWISRPRFSSDGKRLAFADHPLRGDDQGFVTVVDLDGKGKRISGLLNFLHGVAWAPGGGEVFATSGDIDRGTSLKAYSPDGSVRDVYNNAALMRLQDVAPSGRILVTIDAMQVVTEGRLASGAQLFGAWFGESFQGVSSDGRLYVGSSGALLGGTEYRAFYRTVDGGAPVYVGDGNALGVTPDGRWVFAATASRDRSILRAEPTGPGETRRFDLGKVEPVIATTSRATTNADGSRVAFAGRIAGSQPRAYVFDLDAKSSPRAVGPEGVRDVILSPRGDAVVSVDVEGAMKVYPVDGGPARAVPGAAAGEVPVAWSSAGDAVFVWDRTLPARVQRVDLASGRRELAFEWTTRGIATPLYGILVVTPDARYYLMRYRTGVSSLAVVDGVR